MLRTVIAAAFLALLILLAGLPLLLASWLAGTIAPLYPAAVAGLRMTLALAGIRVRAAGTANIPSGACLFFANHTSAVDPVAVLLAVPRRIAFLAKQELFRIPLLGVAMRLAGFVPVDRASREDAAKSADRAVEVLRCGISMVIYPEGTRSPDGRLASFKRGGFLIAIRAAIPVVPVTILGAERVLPRSERWLRPGEIVVQFHSPIDAAACRPEDREALLERVRAAIASALPEQLRGAEEKPGKRMPADRSAG
ncbi:MAG TPA: lysophospholipid acyltransferase family protein [Candidatus Acidoferrales bacterium]|nr:lysophospholipid acyltransferase family protein [Candidatus Acidoferrales bacterium]